MATPSGNRRGTWHQIITYGFVALGLIMLIEASRRGAGFTFLNFGTSVTVFDDVYRLRIRHHDEWLKATLEGEIVLTPEEDGIVRLGPDGYLEIEGRRHGPWRQLVATPGANGEPQLVWKVDRRTQPFDADGQAWLARTLPKVLRATGFDAAGRVARLLARGGVDRVMEEIRAIRGDSTQQTYVELLRQQARLDDEQLERLLDIVGSMMGSDSTLGEVLADLAPDALATRPAAAPPVLEAPAVEGEVVSTEEPTVSGPPTEEPAAERLRRAFFAATGSIGSDAELRRTLEAALAVEPLPYAVYDGLLAAADTIASDHELATLLIAVSRRLPADQPLPSRFTDPLATIASDSAHREVLSTIVAERPLDDEQAERLLTSSLSIASDHEMAGFLIDLATAYPISEALRSAWERALDTVASKGERARVEEAVGSL